MTRHAVLLRGVNVGGVRLPMADLRAVLASIGCTEISTLLQSGNAAVSSDLAGAELAERVRAALEQQLGLAVPVIVRSADELRAALLADPLGELATDPRRHLLAFFSAIPDPDRVAALAEAAQARQAKNAKDCSDRYEVIGAHGYLWCAVNVHESLFATMNWDRLLGVRVTMRNFATVEKLAALLG